MHNNTHIHVSVDFTPFITLAALGPGWGPMMIPIFVGRTSQSEGQMWPKSSVFTLSSLCAADARARRGRNPRMIIMNQGPTQVCFENHGSHIFRHWYPQNKHVIVKNYEKQWDTMGYPICRQKATWIDRFKGFNCSASPMGPRLPSRGALNRTRDITNLAHPEDCPSPQFGDKKWIEPIHNHDIFLGR